MYAAEKVRKSVKVFISYAHADQELHKKLEEHLSPLKRLEKITIWQDQEIPAGADWQDQIHTCLAVAAWTGTSHSPYGLACVCSPAYCNSKIHQLL